MDAAILPPASLVVCSRDRPRLLLDMVRSVLAGEHNPGEIVVVDQSASPHPALAAPGAFPTVRYLWTKDVGVSRARNRGIAEARWPIVALADDDVLVAPTWFGTLVRALVGAGERTVVTGQVQASAAEAPGGFAPSSRTEDTPRAFVGRVGRDVLYTGNMALFRSAIDAVGGFDERLGPGTRFPAAEDNDLGFRLLEAGYRILYVPNAVVCHRAWRAERELVGLRWRYGRGQGAYFAKHLSLRDPYMMGRLVRHCGRHLARSARGAIRGAPRARGELAYVAGLLVGAVQWIGTARLDTVVRGKGLAR